MSLALILLPSLPAHAARNDFDGDGRSDLGTYEPTSGLWTFQLSSGDGNPTTTSFGFAGTLPVTGDFDGDGRTDLGCYDPAKGDWFFLKTTAGFDTAQFGYPGTLPLSGDFDGDGKDDFGCYADDTGDWFFMMTSNGFSHTQFGYDGTLPLVGDFDGDGKDDYGCYEPPSGRWFFMTTSNGFYEAQFGFDGTLPAVGDFDGDGKDDFGCHLVTSYGAVTNWYLMESSNGFFSAILAGGLVPTFPVVGDNDADGRADYGNYGPRDGMWQLAISSSNSPVIQAFGRTGSFPIGTTPLPADRVANFVPFSLNYTTWSVIDGRGQRFYINFYPDGVMNRQVLVDEGTYAFQYGNYKFSGTRLVGYCLPSDTLPIFYMSTKVDTAALSMHGVYSEGGPLIEFFALEFVIH